MVEAIIGLAAGIISGMGIGGGVLLIPALTIFLGIAQHEAQATNLFYFIPTALVSLFIHIKNNRVDFKAALPLIASGLLGSAVGAWGAFSVKAELLRRLFAVFLAFFGAREIFLSLYKGK